MRTPMYETPLGPFEHPWINTPDTKYNKDGVFQLTVVLQEADLDTVNLIHLIDEQAEAAFKEQTKGLSKVELKKWTIYKPYDYEEDPETGDKTGRVKLHFKRNHIITLKGGEKKELSITVYDSTGNKAGADEVPAIYGGTIGQVLFSFRQIKVAGAHLAGSKLDFAAVKVFKLAEGRGSDPFSKSSAAGGYVNAKQERRAQEPSAGSGADDERVDY